MGQTRGGELKEGVSEGGARGVQGVGLEGEGGWGRGGDLGIVNVAREEDESGRLSPLKEGVKTLKGGGVTAPVLGGVRGAYGGWRGDLKGLVIRQDLNATPNEVDLRLRGAELSLEPLPLSLGG